MPEEKKTGRKTHFFHQFNVLCTMDPLMDLEGTQHIIIIITAYKIIVISFDPLDKPELDSEKWLLSVNWYSES